VEDLLKLQAEYIARVRAARLTGVLVRDIVERLIGSPFVTTRSISAATGKTQEAARNAIARLVDLGVLRERTGRSYARVYEAAEVSRILRRR
jgi:Fic family protein